MKKIWAGTESQLFKISGNSILNEIPKGIWVINKSITGIYLSKVDEEFTFKHKVYGKDFKFINHVLKTYENYEKNLGVLLNGVKGAGKSVTAKILANKSNLPIIIVDGSSINDLSYFNDINQPLCFFIDEFEKITPKDENNKAIDNAELLSFIDGYSNSNKHLFLFTSNSKNISDYFIDRPGRIRYIKEYSSLPEDVINEIVEDMLINKSFKQSIVNWVKYFKYLTIDTLISIIQEINIHNIDPSEFKEFFNADNEKSSFNIKVSLIENDSKFLVHENEFLNQSITEYLRKLVEGDTSIYIDATRINSSNESAKVQIPLYASDYYNEEELLSKIKDDKIIISLRLGRSYISNEYKYFTREHSIEINPDVDYQFEFLFIRKTNFFKNVNAAF